MLGKSTGPNGFGVTVADALLSGTIHRALVTVTNDSNAANDVTGSTGGVLFAINLQPLATATSTNLYLYNSSGLNKTDAIYDVNASPYVLSLPASLTNALYNAAYDFQANVIANTLPTLSLGGQMNTASGAVAPIPSVPTTGGTATVYANIANPNPAGNGLYNWTVVLNYDPTQFTLPNPTWGGDLQLGTVETSNNGSGGNGIGWTAGSINQQNVNSTDEEVVVTAFTLQTTPVSNTYFGSLFSITFHVNTSTATPQTSYIHLLASTTSPGYPQTLSTTLSGAAGNQTFSPSIPNGSLDAAVTLPSNGPQTSTTVTSSNPSVTYGTPVTFTAVVSAATGSFAPSQGNVDFKDTTTNTDFQNGTFLSSSGTSSTWTFTTGVKTFNFTTGDAIVASYSGDAGFNGSNGSTIQIVNKAPLTFTALPNTKTYDGTTSAAATPTVVGLVGSDTVTGLGETYDTKNAGTGKTLTVAAGYAVSDGNSGRNYTVTTANSTAGVIDKATLTITALPNTKTYDSTTSAAATPTVVGLVGSDTVTGLSETYDTKNVGTGKTLTIAAGYAVSDGNSGGNYTLNVLPQNTAGLINKATLTITAKPNTKTYDSATSAAATPTVAGLVGSDTVSGLSETYDNKNAGTGKTLTVAAGYTVSDGNSGGNYTVNVVTQNTTGVINKAPLTITAAANTKTYNSTASAAATPTVVGLAGSDTVTGLSEAYDTKNAGTGKTLTVAAGYTVSDGNGGGNYTVTTATSTAGVINKAPLTITALANTKTYDGTTSAAATPTVVGLVGSDTVTGLSETYDTALPGTGKTLTVSSGYVVNDGNSGNNYAVSSVTNTTGVITSSVNTTTSLTTSSGSVVYGTTVTFMAVVSASTGSVAPAQGSVDFKDTTANTDFGNGTFVSSGGTSSTWTFTTAVKTFNVTTGDSIQATYAPGAGFAGSSCTTTQAVTALPITVTAATSTKTYDGTTSSTATPTISGAVVTTLAGYAGYSGSSDGTGSAARFDYPEGVAVDSAGNVYVADQENDEIRKITPSGAVTTLAGAAGQTGSTDGTGSAARFDWPAGLAVDSVGNLYVADQYNQEIRKITPSGVVTTLAGSARQIGSSDGTGSAAGFYYPSGVAVDSAGNVYVADEWNDEIRKITPSGVVTTLAGSVKQTGSSNGTGTAARFNYPQGVAVDSAGNLYVADTTNEEIRKITPSGVVTTLAGAVGPSGSSDGSGGAARFWGPSDVAVDSAGNVYVADLGNDEIRKITPLGGVTTLAGSAGKTGSSNGVGTAARFWDPWGVAVDSAGNVYVSDGNQDIRAICTGLVSGDTPAFSETYNTKNAGTGLTLTPAGSVNDGNGGHNYAVTFASDTTGQITPLAITVTASANTKTYDGTTTAAAAPTIASGGGSSPGLLGTYYNNIPTGGSFTPDLDPTNAAWLGNLTPSAVEYLEVPVSLPDIAGTSFTAATGPGGASGPNVGYDNVGAIWQGSVTIPASAGPAGTPVPISFFTGSDDGSRLWIDGSLVVDNDYMQGTVWRSGTVSLVPGSTHSILIGYIQGGGGANLYVNWDLSGGASQANSVPIPASAFSSGPLVGGDTATFTESYASPNAGTGLTLTPTGSINDGNGGHNYLVSLVASTTGQITPLAITVTAAAGTKTYDGTTSSTAAPTITSGSVVATLAGSAGYAGSNDGTGTAARFYNPSGTALDSAGNVYVADESNDEIRKISPSGVVSTLAGSAGQTGSSDGAGTAARFGDPRGLAVDSAGNVYVVDTNNDEIRKITPSGMVSTLAGSAGQTGSSDGTGAAARFNGPTGVAVDSAGNVYVVDYSNQEIRKISPSGAVGTLAGSAGQAGSSDGTGSAQDSIIPMPRRWTARAMSTWATATTRSARSPRPARSPRWPAPSDRAVPPMAAATRQDSLFPPAWPWTARATCTLAICSTMISAWSPPRAWSAPWPAPRGRAVPATAPAAPARFYHPQGVAVDGAGNLYVADQNNGEIRKITNAGLVSGDTPAFSETYDNKNAGTGKTLTPAGSVNDGNGGHNYTVTFVTNTAGQITPLAITVTAVASSKTYDGTTSSTATPTITASNVVTTLAGSAGQAGSSDGSGSAATFNYPEGVAVDSAGNVYVADDDNTIRKISPSGVVTTLAGSPGLAGQGSNDGTGSAAKFYGPTGVAVDSAGNVYVADQDNDEIRKITPSGVVTTLAGAAGYADSRDGTGSAARFDWPSGVAVDSAGNVYVADELNWEIRKITPSGVVTTLAGSAGQYGSSDGTGTAARFHYPLSVAVDSAGNLYVADYDNDEIRKITPSGVVSTLAGAAGQYGSSDGSGSAARFYNPYSVAADSTGNVYVADWANDEIRKITSSGMVTTLAGAALRYGSSDGAGSAARFANPTGVAVDNAGNVYVADTGNDEIRKISTAALAAGDTAAFSETYNTKNAGTGKTLTPAGSVSDGNGGHNYAVTFVTSTAGVISQAGLTITAATNTKNYDGTTSAAATPTVTGLQGTDTVTGLSETYDTAQPGTGKTLTVSSGYVLSDGNSGNNYAVTTVVNTTGVINNIVSTTTSLTTFCGSVVYGTPVTFTAVVSASGGTGAPTQGSVDFKDTTTSADFGNGTFVTSSGTSSTWTFTTGVKTFNVITGDSIQATYAPVPASPAARPRPRKRLPPGRSRSPPCPTPRLTTARRRRLPRPRSPPATWSPPWPALPGI